VGVGPDHFASALFAGRKDGNVYYLVRRKRFLALDLAPILIYRQGSAGDEFIRHRGINDTDP